MKLLLSYLIYIYVLLITGESVNAAEKQSTGPAEKILARVGDKTISVDEFIKRAEYTIRPKYCKDSSAIQKKIILNSLIAEKLIAWEAGEQNDFISNPKVQAYLKGREEQAMRLVLYNNEVIDKTVVDTILINNTYPQAGRTYKIRYVSVADSLVASQIQSEIHSMKLSLERLLKENYSLKVIPEREVSFNNSEHPQIIDSLFTKNIRNNQIIGPIKIETGETIFIEVIGWTDKPAITQDAISKRFDIVTDLYRARQEKKVYENYIQQVMKGKKIVFDRDIFFSLVEIFAPVYILTEEQEEKIKQQGYLGNDDVELKINNIKPKLSSLLSKVLFSIDHSEWTVQKLLDEMTSHPLVFRKTKIKDVEFGQELQFAIMDLVRDKYLTEEAMKAGYGESSLVKREYSTWKDNLNFISERTNYLKSIGEYEQFTQDYYSVITKHLNKYITRLQQKYDSFIEIDFELLKKIELTKIDMAASYSGSPFTQVVPNFPVITTDYHLNYGRKMLTGQN